MRNFSDGLSAGFHLSFPCTMNVTAIATMHIVLHLESKTTGRRVDGSPLAFSLRKRCEAATPNIGLYAAYFSTSRKPSESVNRPSLKPWFRVKIKLFQRILVFYFNM